LTGPLAGKVALVTGAGRGIGRALSLGLVDAGARVAILARSQDELDEVAGAMRQRGGTALVIAADLGDPRQLADAASRALGEFAAVDLLINNAAVVWPLGPTSIVDPADWASAMAINVTAPVTLTRALLPGMLERGFGRIVNVSSGVAAHPAAMIGGNAYTATKAALEAHTLNLAAELAGSGVTQRVPARHRRHHDAGLDSRPATRAHRRRTARSVHQSLRTGLADPTRAIRPGPSRASPGQPDRRDLERHRRVRRPTMPRPTRQP